MTDQELTLRAAEVAGVKFEPGSDQPHPKSNAWFGLWLTFEGEPPEHARRYWNPLADDGDAFRLAVKLSLRVDCYDDQVETMDGCAPYKIGRETFTNTFVRIEGVGEDKMAAARRAIVRAAAEISIRAKDTP